MVVFTIIRSIGAINGVVDGVEDRVIHEHVIPPPVGLLLCFSPIPAGDTLFNTIPITITITFTITIPLPIPITITFTTVTFTITIAIAIDNYYYYYCYYYYYYYIYYYYSRATAALLCHNSSSPCAS